MTPGRTAIGWTIATLDAVITGLVAAGAFLFHGYFQPILPTAASTQDALRSLAVPQGLTIVFAAVCTGRARWQRGIRRKLAARRGSPRTPGGSVGDAGRLAGVG